MITKFNESIKFDLPNGTVLIILRDVLLELQGYRQLKNSENENGGFLLGYENIKNHSIIIENITTTQPNDIATPLLFIRKDKEHINIAMSRRAKKQFYLGNWHTHPFRCIEPSKTDLHSWRESLDDETIPGKYMIFLIMGTKGFKIWIGNMKNKKIEEIFESEKDNQGRYIKVNRKNIKIIFSKIFKKNRN